MADDLRIERDEFVSCPGCDRTIAKIRRDLREGDQITADLFEAMAGVPVILPMSKAICPDCDDFWCDGRRLHIEGRGWV